MIASVQALLASIVDYAGLFPPAKLDLRQAMTNYIGNQLTPYAWMQNRFVLPVSRLNEFEALLQIFLAKEDNPRQWSLSLIVPEDVEAVIQQLKLLNNRNDITVTALEFPPLPPREIERILPHLPMGVDAFFEIPLTGLEAYLRVLQHTGAAAKVRTGGITVDAFPSFEELCQCIFSFAEAEVPFKATAGLHHPLPGNYRLTYEPDSPTSVMHGFLNVAVLAALVYWQKVTLPEALEVLQDSTSDGFQFTAEALTWRDYRLESVQIQQARQRFFRSFGSCSFQEPVDELKELKLY
ncbi:hypothetical protein BZZ01_21120 [Nostocales cyanobacterium HT-58-2]|nr:hypothetical protein BZZ01_21120 [Nostocales cyanobacterium HT-58-2]